MTMGQIKSTQRDAAVLRSMSHLQFSLIDATLSRDFVAYSPNKFARENCRCDIGLKSKELSGIMSDSKHKILQITLDSAVSASSSDKD